MAIYVIIGLEGESCHNLSVKIKVTVDTDGSKGHGADSV